MVRSIWQGAVVVMLAWVGLAGVGLAWSQQARTSADAQATMTVYENGKEVRCRVLSSWQTANGSQAYQLQAIATGEMLTLLEDGPANSYQGRSGKMRALSMKIFHWGRFRTPPDGTPMPPAGEPIIIEESQPTLITVGATGATGNSDATGCQTCESSPGTTGSRSRRILGSSGECNTCDTCGPPSRLTKGQAGCGCDNQVYAQGPIAPAPVSPYAPIASGISSSSGGGAHQNIAEEKIGVPPVASTMGVPMPLPNKADDGSAAVPPVVPALSETSPYAPSAQTDGGKAVKTTGLEGAPMPVPDTGSIPQTASPVVPAPPEAPQIPIPSGSTSTVPALGSQPGTLPLVPNQPVPAVIPGQPMTFPQPSTQPTLPNTGRSLTSDKPADTAKDWHNMWGKLPFAKTKQPGQTLVDPTPTGKGPALPKQDTTPTEAAKQADPLLNPERYQPQAVERKMERVGVYVPRPAQDAMPAGGPPLPLGSVSVVAAQNGMMKQVQFVPVPVPTVPQPWRAPAPPVPEMPQAPSPNSYVNAFTSPKPQMPQQQPQGPSGAFTTPPNGGPASPTAFGPMPYGPMPYGPMPYGQMPYGPGNDPRMMAAYGPTGPQGPQGMYTPGPYMNMPYMPPSLTNPLPAYAYQQMAQGLPPQRPVAQVNYPLTYPGPTPPNPFATQTAMPYAPQMPVYANPAMDRPGLAAPAAGGNIVPVAFNASKSVHTLRESLYPAERETAVIALANQDLRAQPDTIQALVTAARSDPAGTVRAACVRCLARQQLNNEQVVNTFNDLKNDQDPRVRLEVEQALAQMHR
jgi:hypothetical protein